MSRGLAVLLVCGCYAPAAPIGAVCDPDAPRCPSGQRCLPSPDGYACNTTESIDGAVDTAVDAAPLQHVQLAAGWSAAVFQDFSAEHVYKANDFVDGTEQYDNQPEDVFALYAPFPAVLAITAGRSVIELNGTSFVAHDYGQHAPNTAGRPDNIGGGTFAAGLGVVLVASSSANAGDGTYEIAPDWAISGDVTLNNVRGVMWDRNGAFDARGSAEGYLGTQANVVRRSDGVAVATGDTRTMVVIGSQLWLTRDGGATERLIRVASLTHAETVIAESATIRIGDGAPPGYVGWAIVDGRQVMGIRSNGQLDMIAEHSDPEYVWHAVTSPEASHPLAGRAYLLESNRTRDIDRIIALAAP